MRGQNSSKTIEIYVLVSNKDIDKIKSLLADTKEREMEKGIVRPELWISEVFRIKSHIGGINEVGFIYSMLYAVADNGMVI